jgi:predicted cupin superfamily sugar epimerase
MSTPPHPLTPSFPLNTTTTETPSTTSLITALSLTPHPEGGYFAELDRDPLTIPNPFSHTYQTTSTTPFSGDNTIRNASTSIYYLLTPVRPQGHFHRNAGRTVHTLIQGRGVYVLIHDDEVGEGGKKRVESFVVGKDVQAGERCVWVVEGGKYKASFLLPVDEGKGEEEGGSRLLISEVCCVFFYTLLFVGGVWNVRLMMRHRLWFRASSTRITIS